MLKKLTYVCSKCGLKFDTKEQCETHESWCTPAFRITVEIILFLKESTRVKYSIVTNVDVNPTRIVSGKSKVNVLTFEKRMYLEEEEDQDNEIEVHYTASKIVLADVILEKEASSVGEQLIQFINSELDKQKELVNSNDTKDKLDKEIKATLEFL